MYYPRKYFGSDRTKALCNFTWPIVSARQDCHAFGASWRCAYGFTNLRPMSIAAEASAQGMTDSHDEVPHHYGKCNTLQIRTGSVMFDQFREYIGLAHPFAIPFHVSGVDFPSDESPRRKLSVDNLGVRQLDMRHWPGYVPFTRAHLLATNCK